MGYVVATVNMKGGVGKTTLTVNIATCLVKNHICLNNEIVFCE